MREFFRKMDAMILLRALPEATVEQLLDKMVRVKTKPGEHLMCQGDLGDGMYVVESGQLEVCKRIFEEREEEILLETIGPGGHIGELSLLYNRPRNVSVRVASRWPAVLWKLRSDDFLSILGTAREMASEVEDLVEPEDAPNMLATSIFVVSDGTGSSAEKIVKLALRQFDHCYETILGANLNVFDFVRTKDEVLRITRRARENNALVVHTLMLPEPRQVMTEEVERKTAEGEAELNAVDLWDALLSRLEVMLKSKRCPPVQSTVSRETKDMLEAIEFTRMLDDGAMPHLWKEADVVLIGLSRAGKTPLSFYLAQRGYKVANYPVVPGEDPPKELFDPAVAERCVGLTIEPDRLRALRVERIKEFGMSQSAYASMVGCTREVSWLKTFFMKEGSKWPKIDTTNAGVEENASKIIRLLKNGGITRSFGSPSVE